MAVFTTTFFKTISILLSIIVGFLAGRFANVNRESIASLLFYFISPIVFFSIPAGTNLTLNTINITIVTFVSSTILAVFSYYFFGRYWQDYTRNMIVFSSGNANTGHFMLPIAASLFDDYTLSMYMMAIVGISIFESSIGFYLIFQNANTTKENLLRLIKLPMLNAFILGCILSYFGFILPDFLDDFIYNMRSAYSVLGMIMVGLGLSQIKHIDIDLKFTAATFLAKFVFYPVLIHIFILLDKFIFHLYGTSEYEALQLLSVAPLASNLIVISSLQNFYPERVAMTVFLSILFSVFYVPLMVSVFFGFSL